MTRRPHARLALAALPLVLVLGVAACGDDEPDASGESGTTTTTEAEAQPEYSSPGDAGGSKGEKGTIVAADFSLTDLTVAPGEEIVLRNDGEAPHTATADDGEFDLGQVSPGETSEPQAAPDEPGEYAFHCEIHQSMTATLTVEG